MINVANSFEIPFEEDEKDPKTWPPNDFSQITQCFTMTNAAWKQLLDNYPTGLRVQEKAPRTRSRQLASPT